MGELVEVICFRAPTWMKEELWELAEGNRRKLSDVVRLLVEAGLERRHREQEKEQTNG